MWPNKGQPDSERRFIEALARSRKCSFFVASLVHVEIGKMRYSGAGRWA